MKITKIKQKEREKAINYMREIVDNLTVPQEEEKKIKSFTSFIAHKPFENKKDDFNIKYEKCKASNNDNLLGLYESFLDVIKFDSNTQSSENSQIEVKALINCITEKRSPFGLSSSSDRSQAGGIDRLIRLIDKEKGKFNKTQVISEDLIQKMKYTNKDDSTDNERYSSDDYSGPSW